jgi:hypothetical protein
VTFILVTIAVIGVALWTSSVKAKVTVKVRKNPVAVDTVLDIASVPAAGQIKGRVVSGNFTESKEFMVQESTGTVALPPVQPQGKATGKVKIINNYSKPQPLVVKTRLLTADGRLYRITKSIEVPAGGSVEVEAVSDQEGAAYAMPANTHLTIPGLWKDIQPLIYAQTITAFGNAPGEAASGKIVTADALAKAHEQLFQTALDKAKQTLKVEAGADPAWEFIFIYNEPQQQSNAAVGQATDRFLAQVKVSVTAVFYPKEDVAAYVQTRLNEKVPEGYTLSGFDQSKVSYRLDSSDPAKGTARLAISAEGESRLSPDSPALRKDLIVGLSSDDVIRKWSALDGVESVDVELQPSWVHRLPSMKDKITLVIN